MKTIIDLPVEVHARAQELARNGGIELDSLICQLLESCPEFSQGAEVAAETQWKPPKPRSLGMHEGLTDKEIKLHAQIPAREMPVAPSH